MLHSREGAEATLESEYLLHEPLKQASFFSPFLCSFSSSLLLLFSVFNSEYFSRCPFCTLMMSSEYKLGRSLKGGSHPGPIADNSGFHYWNQGGFKLCESLVYSS